MRKKNVFIYVYMLQEERHLALTCFNICPTFDPRTQTNTTKYTNAYHDSVLFPHDKCKLHVLYGLYV